MSLVTLSDVSKQYSERLLLDHVDLMIQDGDRIGLIGVNGSGKSTLLRLVAGMELPDTGSVTVRGKVRVEFLAQDPVLADNLSVLETIFRSDSPQMRLLREYERAADRLHRQPGDVKAQRDLTALSAEMERMDGWAAEANAKAILSKLGVDDFEAPVRILSGGQRKRVALARALIDRADLLILDEPTNHIDADTVAWLEDYLAAEPGALLLVTHDRYFLDRVVNRIVELDRRKLVSYAGSYTRYLEHREERHDRLAADEAKHQSLLRRELAWLRRGAMARSTKQKARVQRVEELQTLARDRGEETVALALATRRLGKKVLFATGLTKRYDDLTLFEGLDFRLEPGDRIGIIGPNGAGKSTFLDILAGKTQADAGVLDWGDTVQLGYFDQRSQALDLSKTLIKFIHDEAPLIRTKDGEIMEAAQMLEWFLFDRKTQWGTIAALSGGEKRRLYLLRTLIHQPNVLFLDEPTNDLDIQTLTVLEEFLDNFTGTLVVVSHDRYFLDRTVDFLVNFDKGVISPRYPAPYETFQRLTAQAEAARSSPPPPSPTPKAAQNGDPAATKPARLSWKEERELAQIENYIEEMETRKADLQGQINAIGSDYASMQSLADELSQVEVKLDQVMDRWMELSEKES
ncbi:MAG: ABC-F family ATP-binding cassette domain-containing protein [Caldilineaceae bacterium]|nr:ABC-F family ATP-binding cassette domain-containing protein [Caldilineaceae bacterium]